MTAVRTGAITLKGNPVDLTGPELSAGSEAPAFVLQNNGLEDVTLESLRGKTVVIATVPSLDTPVCHAETVRFNQEVQNLSNVVVLAVSTDLPFGQKRWCGAESVENVVTLSDHRTAAFAADYGVLITGGPLDRCLARAIFVVDPQGTLKHVEYVGEVAEHPNYEEALAAASACGT